MQSLTTPIAQNSAQLAFDQPLSRKDKAKCDQWSPGAGGEIIRNRKGAGEKDKKKELSYSHTE